MYKINKEAMVIIPIIPDNRKVVPEVSKAVIKVPPTQIAPSEPITFPVKIYKFILH